MDLMVFSMLYLVNRIIFQKQHFFVTIMIITDIGSSSFLSIQRGFLFCWFWIKFVAGGFALVDKSKKCNNKVFDKIRCWWFCTVVLVDKSKKCNNKVFEKPFTTVFLLWREEDASTWKCPPNRLKNHFNCDDELKRERLKIRRCQSR